MYRDEVIPRLSSKNAHFVLRSLYDLGSRVENSKGSSLVNLRIPSGAFGLLTSLL